MQNDKGLIDKHPSYITEKMQILSDGYHAFGYLDIYNMKKVIDWHKEWNVEVLPKVADEFFLQEQARADLAAKGIIL